MLNTDELHSIGAIFEGVEPSKIDFAYAEQLVAEIERGISIEKSEEDKFSDEHTDAQKAALIFMLKQACRF